MKNFVLPFFCLCLFSFGCGDSQEEIDKIKIEEYVAEQGLDVQSTDSGLYYVINEPGGDEKPSLSSEVQVCYVGYLLNGSEFDDSYTNGVCSPVIFPLAGVINGWQEGLQLFGRGGSGILLVPSNLAYGSTGNGPIGPDTVLGFDVELIDFN